MKAATNHISRIAQLGERQTEDLKVTCSIHVSGIHFLFFAFWFCLSFVCAHTAILYGEAHLSDKFFPHHG